MASAASTASIASALTGSGGLRSKLRYEPGYSPNNGTRQNGGTGPGTPFWRVPLFGEYPGSYRSLLRKPPEPVSAEAMDAVEAAEATETRQVKGAA